MATTVQAANLTVTISESVNLSSHSYGNTKVKSISAQGQVDQRIMNIAVGAEGAFTDILDLSTVDSAGQVVVADFGYFRITNLDDTNYVTLKFYKSATASYFIKLEAGESYLLMSPDMDAQCEAGAPTLGDVTKISADANTAAVDIEYLVVTTGDAV